MIIMELWDLYDEHKNKLNKYHIRGEKLQEGEFHLVVHVWIKNKKNEYLLSKRSFNKTSFPLMWECVGGSVLKDENTYDAGIREVFEEVGIDLSHTKGKFITSFVRTDYQDIVDVYEFNYDGEADLNKATTDEVIETKWVTKEEIENIFNEGKLMPTLKYFINRIR